MVNNNSEYIIFHGLPGSGKSTLAARLLDKLVTDGKNVINVNRDNLRTELFGEEYHNSTPNNASEKEVSKVMMECTLAHLAGADNVVINDDCNMNPKFMKILRKDLAVSGANITHVFINTPVEVAKARNKARGEAGGRLVPYFVIHSMAKNKFTDDIPPVIDTTLFVEEGERIMTIEALLQ